MYNHNAPIKTVGEKDYYTIFKKMNSYKKEEILTKFQFAHVLYAESQLLKTFQTIMPIITRFKKTLKKPTLSNGKARAQRAKGITGSYTRGQNTGRPIVPLAFCIWRPFFFSAFHLSSFLLCFFNLIYLLISLSCFPEL